MHAASISTKAQVTLAGGALGFNWLPVFVAERLGILERHGLQVTLKRMGTVDKATAAVRSGEADLAITPPEGAIADAISGGRLRIIAGNANRLPMTLVAHPRIKHIRDLKGCVLGTSSMTEGTAIYTMAMLAQHGLKYPGDYEFAVVGVHPERWQALQDGRIDAAVQPVPLNFVAIDAGYSNLGEVTDAIPEIAFTTLIGVDGWLEQNQAKIRTLLISLIQATHIIYDPSQENVVVPILAEITKSSESHSRRALAYMREKALFPPRLEIPAPAFKTTVDLMIQAGLLDSATRERAAVVLDTRHLDALAG
ncbi:ABC transporter substrate-binding protein [Bradyrhizobium manausense]|uniref:ABC transporter substrate-binding protein n=1 Tax=Bradyrhizobium manausense TaxID=989370 RepID=UPI001BA70A62|nr:ABC transporter substrate-binding protein [Bradyrhizobium manausense]MBR0828575.1 ABC transporter substrate-binding protein [Bradyrhizobium manausense]